MIRSVHLPPPLPWLPVNGVIPRPLVRRTGQGPDMRKPWPAGDRASGSARSVIPAAAMHNVEDQDHELAVVDLIQDAPVTSPHPPCTRVAHERSSLRWPRVLAEPFDDGLHPPLDALVQPAECLPRLVAEYDLAGHRARIGPPDRPEVTSRLRP